MVQQTFDKVPEIGQGYQLLQERRDAPISRVPMTSKMAKKAHLKKTATKKLSRQEERMEQLRIKAELRERDEREKRERKAEALREKKREKEQRMKEDRKKKGMPLVDVRPSQETLTRFFRGNGSDKKRDSTGTAVQLEAVQEETSEAESDNSVIGKAPEAQIPHPVPVAVDETAKPATEEAKPAPPKPFKRFRTGCTPRKEENHIQEAISRVPFKSAPSKSKNPGPPAREVVDSEAESEEDENETEEDRLEKEIEEWNRKNPLTDSGAETFLEDTVDMAREMEEEAAARHDRRYGIGIANSTKTNSRISYCHQEYDPYLDSCFDDLSDHENNDLMEYNMLMDELAAFRRDDRLPAMERAKTALPSPSISRASGTSDVKKQISRGKENEPPKLAPACPPPTRPPQAAPKPTKPAQPRPTIHVEPLKETTGNKNSNITAKQSMPPPPLPLPSKPSVQGVDNASKPLVKPVVTPVSRPLLRQATYGSAKQNVDSAGSDMPSCTQLLDISMADLADLLPSPSQEVRELEGALVAPEPLAVSKPAFAKPQVPTWKPKPPGWKPPPPVWKPAVPAALSPTTAAPPPRPQVAPPVEDLATFFSTQDLMFSSQDIREVETPNRLLEQLPAVSVCKPLGRTPVVKPFPLAPRPVSSRSAFGNDRLMEDLIDDVEDPRTKKSKPQSFFNTAVSQAASGKAVPRQSALVHAARYGRRSSQAGTPLPPSSMQSSAGFLHETPCRAGAVSHSKPPNSRGQVGQPGGKPSTATPTTTSTRMAKVGHSAARQSLSPAKRHDQASATATATPHWTPAQSPEATEPQLGPPKPSASPPRKRLLTSSNIPLLVAEERSRKSYREEQRARELQDQEAELLRRKEETERKKREAEDLRRLQEEADKAMMGNSSIDDLMNDDFFLEQMFSQRVYAAVSQAKVDDKDSVAAASQETDYGDMDFPSMTQLGMAPTQGRKKTTTAVTHVEAAQGQKTDGSAARRVEASQETDYGDVDLDMIGEDVEVILKEGDFFDEDYP